MHKTCPKFKHCHLLNVVRNVFKAETNGKDLNRSVITLSDCLMSACAIFSQKFSSLLQFDKSRTTEKTFRHNLKTLYGVENAPCDTYMRERLDGLDISIIQKAMKSVISVLKRTKKLNNWKFIGNKFLVSIDGTQFFSSKDVHCSYCCEKNYKNKKGEEYKIYYHQMVVASIVYPQTSEVIPIAFEPICNEDGYTKNDCERNATKRLLANLKKDHPELSMIIVADGLSSNAPFINIIKENGYNYLLVAKDDDHKYLLDYFWAGEGIDVIDFILPLKKGSQSGTKQYRCMEDVPINASNLDVSVTVIYTKENLKYIKKNGDKDKEESCKWMWVTDLDVTRENIVYIEKGGRARWKIENETFNTLKNQGYNFEHNYGHGYKTLSNLFASIMLLVFLIDQILQSFNKEFQACWKKCGSKMRLWEKIRSSFEWFLIPDWDSCYAGILDPPAFSFPVAQ